MSQSGDKQRIRNEFDGLVRRVGITSWATIGALILIFFGAYVLIEGRVIFAPLLAIVFWMGISPMSFIDVMAASVANVVDNYHTALAAADDPATVTALAADR